MLISMNWINDFVDLSGLDLEKLIHQFTLSTAEVEDIYYMGRDIKDVVVARIVSIENHPDSKKLHLLKVDAGDKVYDCVCGAPNVREGMLVAFAREGGSVSGMEITCAKIAGYESHGMCCSEKELGISADHSGLWEITDDLPLGTQITDAYGVKDVVFEVDNKSLTNRPDLWGHYGIAREFAALTNRELKPVSRMDLTPYASLPGIDIDIRDKELCYRYTGLKVRNITKKVSPVDMRIRLFYCGMRAINLLADLTNYLMLELGQPMHAFDQRYVKDGKIVVRNAKDGETRYGINGWFGQAMVQSTGETFVKYDGSKFSNNISNPAIEEAEGVMEEIMSLGLYDPTWYGYLPDDGSTLFFGMADWALGASNVKADPNPDYEDDGFVEENDLMIVPFPKQPGSDEYYLNCNFGAKMLVKNSDKGDAVAAYIKCERLAAMIDEYKDAAKEKAIIPEVNAQGKLKSYVTEEQYDALQDYKNPKNITPVFDFGYGMGSRMYGDGEYTYETRGVMNNLTSALLNGDKDSWAVLRDEWSSVIDEVIDGYNNK